MIFACACARRYNAVMCVNMIDKEFVNFVFASPSSRRPANLDKCLENTSDGIFCYKQATTTVM